MKHFILLFLTYLLFVCLNYMYFSPWTHLFWNGNTDMMFCPAQNKLFTEKEGSQQWWSYTACSSWPSAKSGTWPNPLPTKASPAPPASCTDRPGWDITYGSWSWKTHWFHLHWKVLHAPLGFSVAFVQKSYRFDTHYLHTQKRILQPWITNAHIPLLRHHILGSS